MAGMLNIFRLQDSPLRYQVTYNSGPDSWVRVFDIDGIRDFLVSGAAITLDEAESLGRRLTDGGHVVAEIPNISESELVQEHFAKMPSDD